MRRTLPLVTALATCWAVATPALAQVQITEWMYGGTEFIEFTNLNTTPVDFSGWSFDDDSRLPGTVSLSAFGVVGAFESVILTELAADAFRSTWGLSPEVKVIGGLTANLGRNDEINLYNAGGELIDRLSYGDQTFAGTVRTQFDSGNPASLDVLAGTTAVGWVLSVPGDIYGSVISSDGLYVANPGAFALAPIPEPATVALLLGGLGVVGAAARRRRA